MQHTRKSVKHCVEIYFLGLWDAARTVILAPCLISAA